MGDGRNFKACPPQHPTFLAMRTDLGLSKSLEIHRMSLFERKCAVCRGPIEGRKDRKTCSDRCRTSLNRTESQAVAVTSQAVAVTTGGASVTETVGSVTATWAADEPSDELGHWQSADEDSIWR